MRQWKDGEKIEHGAGDTLAEEGEVTASSSSSGNDLSAAEAAEPEGKIIAGKYRLTSLIGSGSGSDVFLARQILLDRDVAIKVMRVDLAGDGRRVRRFQQEAELLGALDHPAIVKTHDYGLLNDGRPYIVMEHVQGRPLSQLLSEGRTIEPELACRLTMSLADALAQAHSKGIVHRDLKPANIIVTQDGDGYTACHLVDFGIARIMENEGGSDLTRTGEIPGTPAYMSPEQVSGRRLDARSDIYSLGCVLYEMICGERLVKAEGLFECMNWHRYGQLPAMSGKSLLANGLARVLTRMLAKDPLDRYQNAAGLSADLTRILKNESPAFWLSRNSTALLAGLLGLLLLLFLCGQFHLFDSLNPQARVNDHSATAKEEQSPQKDFVRELSQRLELIRKAIAVCRQHDNNTTADALENKLHYFEALRDGQAALPEHEESLLMAVCLGCETPENEPLKTDRVINLNIDYTAGPIVLELDARSPVIWRLKTAPGVRLERIRLSGSEGRCDIENVPGGVAVDNQSERFLKSFSYLIRSDRESEQSWQARMDSYCRRELGKDLTAIVASQKLISQVEIGSKNPVWLAQMILSQSNYTLTQARQALFRYTGRTS
jgi:serine/threonine protein kinase